MEGGLIKRGELDHSSELGWIIFLAEILLTVILIISGLLIFHASPVVQESSQVRSMDMHLTGHHSVQESAAYRPCHVS